ncbi:MAG: methyltransferase domain-containing protein [Chitinophagaceae bacterium]
MQNNLERINPDLAVENEVLGQKTLELHMERYRFAAKHLSDGIIADIACGVGYGSYLIIEESGDRVSHIYAIDNDMESIRFANRRYAHSKITFIGADALTYQSPVKLNTIISLETLEHLENPSAFIQLMAAQLVSGGRFIASVPITPSMDANPYHLHDFTIKGFKKMFTDSGMKEIDSLIQQQPYSLFSIAKRKEERSKDLRKNIAAYYMSNPDKLLLRLKSLIKDGWNNKYLVTAFEKQ